MVIDLFYFLGVIGLILITIGVIVKTIKKQNLLFSLGGISLVLYSINIGDKIFIILESVFTLTAIYNLIKMPKNKR